MNARHTLAQVSYATRKSIGTRTLQQTMEFRDGMSNEKIHETQLLLAWSKQEWIHLNPGQEKV